MIGPIPSIAVAGGITFFGEAALMWILGFRSVREQAALLCANAITFPLFHFWLFFGREVFGFVPDLAGYILFELCIWGSEMSLVSFALREAYPFRIAGALFLANFFSFFIGELLVWG